MPSTDSAPHNGDLNLRGRAAREYYAYGWREIRAGREPGDITQATPDAIGPADARSPFRVYTDAILRDAIARHVTAPADVVDIGCGRGGHARLFKRFAGTYHGLDVHEYPEWNAVRRESADWPLAVRFHRMAGEAVGSLDLRVSFSLSSSALEHVDDPEAVVRGLAARTEPGACGVHIVPGPWSLLTYGQHGWRRFSADRLQALFEQAGFERVAVYRLGGAPSTLLHFLWITGLETGWALQSATLSRLPFVVYQVARRIRFAGARTSPLTGSLYRALLRLVLRLDPWFPRMPAGYAIVVRRRPC